MHRLDRLLGVMGSSMVRKRQGLPNKAFKHRLYSKGGEFQQPCGLGIKINDCLKNPYRILLLNMHPLGGA